MAKLQNSKDLILLLLHAPGKGAAANEPINGQTRLMKMLFLFEKELKPRFHKDSFADTAFPEFEAYDYGPYSPKVYADLEWLVNMGFIDVSAATEEVSSEERAEFDYWSATQVAEDAADASRMGKTFSLSERGQRFVERMMPKWSITPEQMAILREFKTRCTEASLHSLLRYTYTRYPEMTGRSKIKKEVLGHG
jgi:uncharacterized protein YwgA